MKEIRFSEKKVLLFDLDGTLTDSGEGIVNSVIYTLKKYGFAVPERQALNRFLGPPLYQSFEEFCGFSPAEAEKAVEVYREYYREKGIFENKPYSGIPELLERLKGEGKTLVIATSKPGVFAEKIAVHYRIASYFSEIIGSELDGGRVDKAEVIDCALSRCGIKDKNEVAMIGDRAHDIVGAKKNGLDSVGVLYGYGDLPELQNAGADKIVESVSALGTLLLKDF